MVQQGDRSASLPLGAVDWAPEILSVEKGGFRDGLISGARPRLSPTRLRQRQVLLVEGDRLYRLPEGGGA